MLPLPAARPLTIHSRPIGSGLEIRTGEPQGHLGSWGFPIRIRGPIPCQGPPGDSPGVSLGIRIENKKKRSPSRPTRRPLAHSHNGRHCSYPLTVDASLIHSTTPFPTTSFSLFRHFLPFPYTFIPRTPFPTSPPHTHIRFPPSSHPPSHTTKNP